MRIEDAVCPSTGAGRCNSSRNLATFDDSASPNEACASPPVRLSECRRGRPSPATGAGPQPVPIRRDSTTSFPRLAAIVVTSLLFAGAAFAGTTTPAPASTPAASTAAATHATGVVKAWNAQTHQLTVTVSGKDQTFDTGTLQLDAAIKVGAQVDVTATGAKATAVTPHKA